jgi:hypothetical protein
LATVQADAGIGLTADTHAGDQRLIAGIAAKVRFTTASGFSRAPSVSADIQPREGKTAVLARRAKGGSG